MKSIICSIILALTTGFGVGPAFAAESDGVKTAKAENQVITEYYEAVGTVRPRVESNIEARVTAQVLDVKVSPGDTVQKGDLLISLDHRQSESRLDQARQGLKSAEAAREQARQSVIAAEAAFQQAEADFKRIQDYFENQAATSRDLEQARSAYLQAQANLQSAKDALAGAEAGIQQAREVIREAEISVGYTRLLAPESGEVLQRLVDPGDMAMPGKPLLKLQTAGTLRLEAYVREGLIRKVTSGTRLRVNITPLEETVEAEVEEIVPYADPQTRTFLVKASIPRISGLYPGMFGKLLIPVREHRVVVIPEEAVRRVGQLELVRVKEGDVWKRRFIQTGRRIDGKVEVLSGLSGGETLALEKRPAGEGS
ncbi:MAG: efflux RND transporter periplasmic adaptor subunit [Thermodesulfobacteriota bacterium]